MERTKPKPEDADNETTQPLDTRSNADLPRSRADFMVDSAGVCVKVKGRLRTILDDESKK